MKIAMDTLAVIILLSGLMLKGHSRWFDRLFPVYVGVSLLMLILSYLRHNQFDEGIWTLATAMGMLILVRDRKDVARAWRRKT